MSNATRRQNHAANLNKLKLKLKGMKDENKFSENNKEHLKLALKVRSLEHLDEL